MAFSSDKKIESFGVTQIAVAANQILPLNLNAYPGAISSWIQYKSGGSLEIYGATYGQSIAANTGGSYLGQGFLLSTTPIPVDGSPFFYLMATGATSVAQVLVGKSSGT